jgi:hypothetical protein
MAQPRATELGNATHQPANLARIQLVSGRYLFPQKIIDTMRISCWLFFGRFHTSTSKQSQIVVVL